MISLLLATCLAFAGDEPADGRYSLPDSGYTLAAPGWHMSRWSDYDFKGHNGDNTVFASAWSTSYQLTLDDTTAKALADAWKAKLEEEEHATDVTIDSVKVEEVGGVKRVRAQLSLTTGAGIKGAYAAAAFPTDGLIAQVATLSTAQARQKGLDALETLLAKLQIDKPAANLAGTEELKTKAGSLALPAGWRTPLPSEAPYVAPLFGKTAAKDPKECTPAIHPRVGGEADILLACPDLGSGGILDGNSFDDEATLYGQRLFGKSAATLAPPERVARGEDVAILFHGNEGLWTGGLATAQGMQTVWVSGRGADDAALGEAARAAVGTFKLAPEATPNAPFGALLFHRLTYDRTHPTVLIPGLLLLAALGFIVRMIFKSAPHPDDPHGGGHQYT